ncbi:MAG: caspase family protein [Pseudomonadota bacterium]
MRVLLAIGCDAYDHANLLHGAERDAQRMYDLLIRPAVGEYDTNRSHLLLSPTYSDVREALREALFTEPSPDTFTFFFAGHGSVSSGAFYMWLRDSNQKGLSMSALSLADMFRSINEAAPLQSNIVIDACESGGLIQDLGALLKPGLLGNVGSPGLTLLATAAQNQAAGESPNGGFGTVALLDCIEGRDFVQDHKGMLDLVEIGMRVSQRLRASDQNPVVWGLNLVGPSGFCKNPRYGTDPSTPLRQALQAWPTDSNDVIRQNYDALWAAYSATGGIWNPKKFSAVVRAVLAPSTVPEVLAVLADRLAVTFSQRGLQARDPFRRVEVSATLAVALLSSTEHPSVAYTAQRLLDHTCMALIDATSALIEDLETDKYALLSDRSGVLSELHELPHRLTRMLGWVAVATFICTDEEQRTLAVAQFAKVVSLILEHYGGSLISLSDAQASGLCIALSACARLGLRDEGELLVGLMFNSLIQCEGRMSRDDVPRDRALEYLLARRGNDFTNSMDLVARPIDLLTVLFKAASQFELEAIFDESLWKIDGLAFSAYRPTNYMNYGASVMEGGENLIWTIGIDVFRIAEFSASWPPAKTVPPNPLVASLALVASLLYPDRQAWFLFE